MSNSKLSLFICALLVQTRVYCTELDPEITIRRMSAEQTSVTNFLIPDKPNTVLPLSEHWGLYIAAGYGDKQCFRLVTTENPNVLTRVDMNHRAYRVTCERVYRGDRWYTVLSVRLLNSNNSITILVCRKYKPAQKFFKDLGSNTEYISECDLLCSANGLEKMIFDNQTGDMLSSSRFSSCKSQCYGFTTSVLPVSATDLIRQLADTHLEV